MKIEEIKATHEWVVLKAVEVAEKAEKIVKNNKGIITANGQQANGQNVNTTRPGGKVTVDLFIHDVGPSVPKDVVFKKDDCVLCDPYDMQTFEDDEGNMFGICHYTKVKAVLKVSR